MTLGDGKYMRLGKRIVHMHAPVGARVVLDPNNFAIDSRSCSTIHAGAPYGFVPDMACCSGCGYAVCSCPAEAAEPPKDVLPEGWRDSVLQGRYRYLLDDGRSLIVQQQAGARWAWCSKKEGTAPCWAGTETYREEAMAAALASVAPVEQEPALRPGWFVPDDPVERLNGFNNKALSARVFNYDGIWEIRSLVAGCRPLNYDMHTFPTAEAAMLRAEELAGGS